MAPLIHAVRISEWRVLLVSLYVSLDSEMDASV